MINTKEYIPVQQKPACCVPAALQMILKRQGLKEYDQETLGNMMGLVVPVKFKHHFKKVAVAKECPQPQGWGTRIDIEKYSLNTVFNKLSLPLETNFIFTDHLKEISDFKTELKLLSADKNSDGLMCIQSGSLEGKPHPINGHIILFTGIDKNNVYYVDPGFSEEGVKKTSCEKMFKGMQLRGRESMGGIWKIQRI